MPRGFAVSAGACRGCGGRRQRAGRGWRRWHRI